MYSPSGKGIKPTSVGILLASTMVLYASTCVYWAFVIVYSDGWGSAATSMTKDLLSNSSTESNALAFPHAHTQLELRRYILHSDMHKAYAQSAALTVNVSVTCSTRDHHAAPCVADASDGAGLHWGRDRLVARVGSLAWEPARAHPRWRAPHRCARCVPS